MNFHSVVCSSGVVVIVINYIYIYILLSACSDFLFHWNIPLEQKSRYFSFAITNNFCY